MSGVLKVSTGPLTWLRGLVGSFVGREDRGGPAGSAAKPPGSRSPASLAASPTSPAGLLRALKQPSSLDAIGEHLLQDIGFRDSRAVRGSGRHRGD